MNRCHQRSERSLCGLLLKLTCESHYYHQVLTFSPVTWNYTKAKRTLDLLLDNLHHRFDMATVYTTGRHKKYGLHFHAGFYFFPDSLPFYKSRMKRDFRTAVFSAWNDLQGGELEPVANEISTYKNPSYFLKNLREVQGCKQFKGSRVQWWGYRNAKLIKKNSVPVSELAVDDECAKRWSPLRRDSGLIKSIAPDSVFTTNLNDGGASELEPSRAPLDLPDDEEPSPFEFDNLDTDSEVTTEMAFL